MQDTATPVMDLEPIQRKPEPANLPAVANSSPASMMLAAMQQGASLEQIEKMMELQARWEAGEARKAYNTAFSDFKAEAVKILRNRKVDNGPLQGKRYAELHSVVDAVTPALSKHGLSASWKLTKDEPSWIEVTCTLKHSAGHSESVSMGGPPDTGGAKNKIQERASTISYLERYTLKAICGVAEAGQDDDGNGGDQSDTDEALQAGRDAAMQGTKHLVAWWGGISAKERGRLQKAYPGLRKAAEEADGAR